MTCTELYQLMDHPERLSNKTLPDIRQLMDDYPYFHAIRMLYLKNLSVTQDLRFDVDLKKMAIHIPDRIKLFFLLEGDRYKNQVKTTGKNRAFEMIDHFLSVVETPESDLADVQALIYDRPSSVDYTTYFLQDDNQSSGETPDNKLQHQELIDSFIQSDRKPPVLEPSDEDEDEKKSFSDDLTEINNAPVEEVYFTETLAQIYIKQKRYKKALEIIRNLSLKYPKKNIYFADQMRFLEKLIIYTK